MQRYNFADKSEPFITAWVKVIFEQTREPIEDDQWDSGDDQGILVNYGVCVGSPKHENRDYSAEISFNAKDLGFLPKSGDKVYLVIERHGAGSTFGHTDDCFRPQHVFKTEAQAEAWTRSSEAKECEDHDYFGGHDEWLIKEVVVQ